VDERGQFLAKFRGLLKALRQTRLVIAVDNLDRCSPELVDELLTTIKTYLEPASEKSRDADVVFLIAADDQAVRRHLETRELERRTIGTSVVGIDTDAYKSAVQSSREYVDEFLRKFFSTTIPLKDALEEELRDYALTELKPFISARSPTGRQERSDFEDKLVGMVTQALRKNPRRLKQFVNN